MSSTSNSPAKRHTVALPKETVLTVRESSSVAKKAHASRAKSSTAMKGFTKAKITSGHFSVFEIGST
ncbi:putative protein isoform X4 [Capsicum annuum]